MSDKVVLITGAFGFIGRNVAKLYSEKGWHVVGVGHGEWTHNEQQSWGVSEWCHSSVTKQALIDLNITPNVVVHAAGGSSVPASIDNPDLDFERTVTSTTAVLDFVRGLAQDVKLVYLSTAGVYGNVETLPIKESAKLNPLSPYGKHKLIAENLCIEYSINYNLNISVIRLFSVYGAGLKKQLLWDALKKADANNFNFFGTGEEVRDWLHVNDAACLIYELAQQTYQNGLIINGGSGVGVTVSVLLKELISFYKDKQLAQFNGYAREGDPLGYVADINLATTLGWRPQVSLNKGLKEYVNWYEGLKND